VFWSSPLTLQVGAAIHLQGPVAADGRAPRIRSAAAGRRLAAAVEGDFTLTEFQKSMKMHLTTRKRPVIAARLTSSLPYGYEQRVGRLPEREAQNVVNDDREEVIIIDDDIHIRCAVNLVLSTSGFSTRIFSSAREFLECGQPVPAVGCLVLDVDMPGINGIELQAQLRQREVDLPNAFVRRMVDLKRAARLIGRLNPRTRDRRKAPSPGSVVRTALKRFRMRRERAAGALSRPNAIRRFRTAW
jgi:CheY-like chemotaxis protein